MLKKNLVDVYVISLLGDIDANVIHGLSFSQKSCGML